MYIKYITYIIHIYINITCKEGEDIQGDADICAAIYPLAEAILVGEAALVGSFIIFPAFLASGISSVFLVSLPIK